MRAHLQVILPRLRSEVRKSETRTRRARHAKRGLPAPRGDGREQALNFVAHDTPTRADLGPRNLRRWRIGIRLRRVASCPDI